MEGRHSVGCRDMEDPVRRWRIRGFRSPVPVTAGLFPFGGGIRNGFDRLRWGYSGGDGAHRGAGGPRGWSAHGERGPETARTGSGP